MKARSAAPARIENPPQLSSTHDDAEARLIVDAMPGLAWAAGADGALEYVSARFREYTGMLVDASFTWTHVLHVEDIEPATKAWADAIATGHPYEADLRILRFDRAFRWFRVSAQPMRDESGRVIRWLGVNINIEGCTGLEATDKRAERRLLNFLDALPAIVWRALPDGTPNYMNQRAATYSGRSNTDFPTLERPQDFVYADDLEALRSEWARALETEQPLDVASRHRGADGVYRWFHTRAEPLRDESGRVTHWYGVDVDIDDRKTAEEALRKREQELRLLIDTLPAMVWRATAMGDPDYINQRLATYLGRSVTQLAQQRWREIIHPDDVEAAAQDWAEALAAQTSLVAQYRFRRADGVYRWFQFHAEPLRDVDGRIVHWYGVQIDIDDSKRIEDALRSTQAELSRASELAIVSQLAASIAHEISQPLAALVANGHAAQRWLSADPPNLDRALITAERIIRDGSAAADVVRRIRALFKRTDSARTALDLNDVITEVSRLLTDEFSARNVSVVIDLADDLPATLADRVQMQQVIVNLARNGADAMDDDEDRSKTLTIRSRRHGIQHVVIEIHDQGRGLDDVERVFEPFITTKEQGMGMGLAICRRIVEAHNGRLWASRSEPRGTTFSVALPVPNGVGR